MGADPFEDALAEIEGGEDPFEAALAAAVPEGDPSLARSTAIAQTTSLGFADEIQAGAETLSYGVGEVLSGRGTDIEDLADYYRFRRDAYRTEAGELAESNPAETAQGTAIGVGAQLVGVNPVSVGRGLLTGGRALLSGTPGAARSLLSLQAAKGAGVGAAYGGLAGAGASEGETVSEVSEDALEGAKTGAVVGGVTGGVLKASEAGVASRVVAAEEKAAAAVAAERDQALLKTGLEGRQKKLGGPLKAKTRAQEILDEPMPGDPSKKLFEEAEKLSPDDRFVLAEGLRREQGRVLGGVRDDLAKVEEAQVGAEPVKAQLREAFSELPSDVQAAAIEKVEAMIGAASKDGAIPAAALRKLIKDADANARFGTQATDMTLGNARKRVFRTAYGVLTGNEKELVRKVLPQRAPEYEEALRKYDVYLDFEEGARIKFERANKGQAQIREPKRDDSTGRKLLRTAAGEIGARVGSMIPVPGAAIGVSKGAEALVDRWGRWLDPTVAGTSARLKKIERLRPMMEEALDQGPEAVARLHSTFMARSPDYRKAIESEE